MQNKVKKMRNSYEIGLALEKVLRKLEAIEAKVNAMPQVQVSVSNRFLPTFMAVTKLQKATASELSRVTGRARAFESKNLNEMHAMGLLDKKREGRLQVFSPRKPSVFPTLQEQALKTELIPLPNLKIYR